MTTRLTGRLAAGLAARQQDWLQVWHEDVQEEECRGIDRVMRQCLEEICSG